MRTRLLIGTCVALSILAPASPTRAGFDTGNELYQFCTSKSNFDEGMCLGLVSGYYEGMLAGYDCQISPKVTRGQMRDIVLKFLRENPQERHHPGSLLAARAYFVAFSCQRTQ